MRHQFTAIIEQDEGWFIGYCPEIPGANGQGLTRAQCLENLGQAIELILQDRLEDGLRGVPTEATREILTIS